MTNGPNPRAESADDPVADSAEISNLTATTAEEAMDAHDEDAEGRVNESAYTPADTPTDT